MESVSRGEKNRHRPNKRLGQHFLKDKNAAEQIIRALGPENGDFFIEIGPGRGELSAPFLSSVAERGVHISYLGVEKDKTLAGRLEKTVPYPKKCEISVVHGDAREMIVKETAENAGVIKIFGNIPYYLTGKLFRILTELVNKPEIAVFTIQYEVAERLVSGKNKMNRLAAIVGFWYKTEILIKLGKENFFPPPKVNSAIIKLTLKKGIAERKIYWKTYETLVKNAFSQPRKTALNNMIPLFDGKKSAEAFVIEFGLNSRSRPHEIGIETLTEMARVLYNKSDGRQEK